jgi:serine/threonine protein kinase/tetratricopeptide (TPR) repeat protein
MSTPDPDRWLELSSQLDTALEMTGPARELWLASLRVRDPARWAQLRSLLVDHAALDAAGFLQRSLDSPLPRQSEARSTPPRSAALAGQTFGAYTLSSPIGEGGMGSVWLAHRSDGRFEGRAAVKLLNASPVGRAGEERFTREGTILARLAHASIAHLVDAGVSEGGQPYLVLEYVEGQWIDRYCDERALGIGDRIRLFLEVLAAVAYAHANLVVHRDIKPSNVLVRTDSAAAHAAARVKLLDFGIAKLLEPDGPVDAGLALTRDTTWALTPAFAAPEQLTGQPVTTATDVYSLGVLLYLLLSGHHPAAAGLRSPADLITAVVDVEPPRLSEIVTDAKAHGDATIASHAARRGTTPVLLRHALQGDLETIVAKALKKSPAERYPSVAAFADDLRRVLEQRPISARPETMRYRATKFVRRNRIPVALTAAAVVALVAGLVGTVTQARRATLQAVVAETQRQRADQEARTARAQRDFALGQVSRAEAINDLTGFVLSESASTQTPLTPVDMLARAEGIVKRQRQIDESHVEMLLSIGGHYGSLQHSEKAFDVLSTAYERSRTLTDPGVRARAACAFARVLAESGAGDRAEQLLQDTLRTLPDEPQYAPHRVNCYLFGSAIAQIRREGDVAVEWVRAAETVSKAGGLSSRFLDFGIASNLASAYSHARRPREALIAFADAYRQLTALGRDDTLAEGRLLVNWATLLYLVGRPLEAEPLLRRALVVTNRNPRGPISLPRIHLALTRCLIMLHRWPDAATHAARAYTDAQLAGDSATTTAARLVQAMLYRQLGDGARAARVLTEMEPGLKRLPAPDDSVMLALVASERAWLALARGEARVALAQVDRAVALGEAVSLRTSRMRSLLQRSQIALRLDRVEQAKADALQAIELEQQVAGAGNLSSGVGRGQLALGQALHAQGKLDEARAAAAAAVEHLTPTVGADHPDTRLATQLAAGETLKR